MKDSSGAGGVGRWGGRAVWGWPGGAKLAAFSLKPPRQVSRLYFTVDFD